MPRGISGQRAFARGVEQALGLKPGLQRCRNCSNKAPCPARCMLSTTSCRSPRGSYTPRRPRTSTSSPSRGAKSRQAGSAAKHGAADLPLRVLERKVAMPAGRARKARDFPAHRHRIEARIATHQPRRGTARQLPRRVAPLRCFRGSNMGVSGGFHSVAAAQYSTGAPTATMSLLVRQPAGKQLLSVQPIDFIRFFDAAKFQSICSQARFDAASRGTHPQFFTKLSTDSVGDRRSEYGFWAAG